jgi:hypothetical protein
MRAIMTVMLIVSFISVCGSSRSSKRDDTVGVITLLWQYYPSETAHGITSAICKQLGVMVPPQFSVEKKVDLLAERYDRVQELLVRVSTFGVDMLRLSSYQDIGTLVAARTTDAAPSVSQGPLELPHICEITQQLGNFGPEPSPCLPPRPPEIQLPDPAVIAHAGGVPLLTMIPRGTQEQYVSHTSQEYDRDAHPVYPLVTAIASRCGLKYKNVIAKLLKRYGSRLRSQNEVELVEELGQHFFGELMRDYKAVQRGEDPLGSSMPPPA